MVVNKKQLMEIFGLSTGQIENLTLSGLPVLRPGGRGRGQQSEYDTVAVYDFLRVTQREQIKRELGAGPSRFDEGIEGEKHRKLTIEADLKEIELAEAQGVVVRYDKVESAIVEMVTRFKTRVLALPRRLVPQMEAADTREEAEQVLTSALTEALDELKTDFENTDNAGV